MSRPMSELLRATALAYAMAPISVAIAGIERLGAERIHGITDEYGTNSHYCLAMLVFAESLILGLSEARVGRGPA